VQADGEQNSSSFSHQVPKKPAPKPPRGFGNHVIEIPVAGDDKFDRIRNVVVEPQRSMLPKLKKKNKAM
jgi:hypothetical protein